MKYVLDSHCHTVASGHAYSTISENAKYAHDLGLELIAITDHAPKMPGSTYGLYFLNFWVVPKIIEGIEVLKGVELNILDKDGTIDLKEKTLKRLDIIIASLHPPCIAPMSMEENTQALINTMKNPLINIIGHPGDPRYPIDIKKVVSYARDTNTILEVNNASLAPNNSRAGGRDIILEIIKECKRQGLPIILGSDSHFYTYIGNFEYADELIKEANMPPELILNTSVKLLKDTLKI